MHRVYRLAAVAAVALAVTLIAPAHAPLLQRSARAS
jgi:hypothetical protein